jgi:N-methylhydantoinase A
MRIGVDTGGTFTDCVALEGTRVKILKVFSTPGDVPHAAMKGIRGLVGDFVPADVESIHGTTVGTNTLLERRGARVALITTAGFEDLIEIGRQARPRLYDLEVNRDAPLVSRALRWGVKERTGADGKTLLRLTPGLLRRLHRQLQGSRADSVAVCFLFSFANPANERAVARVLRRLRIPISVSHEILPEFREYERLSTVVMNAYLAPSLGTYLARLESAVRAVLATPDQGPASSAPPKDGRGMKPLPSYQDRHRGVLVMQSSGGITTAARAAREPVRTILSGPAGGVVAAAWLARRLGIRRAISFDMGGTSSDVCLIDGDPRTTNETTVAGLPVAIPVLDVHSVGAGGGSVARFDSGGALRVGPQSAGATPGPICYGRGGTEPTVTDANLLLGRLDAGFFLDGSLPLGQRAVERSFAAFLCRSAAGVGKSSFRTPLELARGIVAVSAATMEKALRVISVERGYDPRDFVLMSFGGAGGLHAAQLARALGLARVIVPENPGAFSALGVLLSDIVKEVSQSVLLQVPAAGTFRRNAAAFQDLQSRLARLARKAREEMKKEGFPTERARAELSLDVRYAGQAYELRVPFARDFRQRFHREHERAYGYADAGRQMEIVNLRLRLVIPTPKPRVRAQPARVFRNLQKAAVKRKPVWFGERFWPTTFYRRADLGPGARFSGPAVIVEYSSTTVVPPDFDCRVDGSGNLALTCRDKGRVGIPHYAR